MKAHSNPHPFAPSSGIWLQTVDRSARLAAGIVAVVSVAIRNMQMARMIAVFNAMSDAELAELEMDRRDIAKRAAEVVGLDHAST